MESSREKFRDKWGFDSWNYYAAWEEVLPHIARFYTQKGRPLRILDLSCGLGATASLIKQIFPGSFVAGVCINSFAAAIAMRMADEVTWGDPNLCSLPWPDQSFDIVIAEKSTVSTGRVMECLVPGGIYINEEGVTAL
jgi:ubiquinone/menaquinone biosynthesis C-methylase UbiE